jgi:hypothetical protein
MIVINNIILILLVNLCEAEYELVCEIWQQILWKNNWFCENL